MAWGIISFKHGIEHPFQVADFIRCMRSRKLYDRIAGGVHKCIYTSSGDLMVGTTNFEIKGRDCVVRGGDVRVEISFGDIFGKRFPPLCTLGQ